MNDFAVNQELWEEKFPLVEALRLARNNLKSNMGRADFIQLDNASLSGLLDDRKNEMYQIYNKIGDFLANFHEEDLKEYLKDRMGIIFELETLCLYETGVLYRVAKFLDEGDYSGRQSFEDNARELEKIVTQLRTVTQ